MPKLSEMMANDKDTKGQALLPKQVHYDEKTKNFLWINGKGAPIAMKKSTEQT